MLKFTRMTQILRINSVLHIAVNRKLQVASCRSMLKFTRMAQILRINPVLRNYVLNVSITQLPNYPITSSNNSRSALCASRIRDSAVLAGMPRIWPISA